VLLPNGEAVAQSLTLQPRRERLAATIAAPATGADNAFEATIPIGIGDLPLLAAGYRALASLTMAPEALLALDPDQIAALDGFLAGCGTLIVPNADPALLEALRRPAGCAGRFVGGIPGIGTPSVLAQPPRLPASIAPEAGPDTRQLALLLLPYPLLLAALALLRRSGPWLLVLPPAAALAYAGALPLAAPPADSATWAETFAGDTHHRFVTLLRSSGGASAALRLPRGTHDLVVVPAGRPHRLHIDRDGTLILATPRALLRYREYRLEGVGRVPFRLRVSASGDSARVENAGPRASPPGWLLWRGAAYPIPAITPGGSHMVTYDPTAGPLPRQLPAQIGAAPSVLVPLPWAPLGAAHPPIHATGWLLVRPLDELPL
jgi:hypothetical protein